MQHETFPFMKTEVLFGEVNPREDYGMVALLDFTKISIGPAHNVTRALGKQTCLKY